jgi:hypothetical protein
MGGKAGTRKIAACSLRDRTRDSWPTPKQRLFAFWKYGTFPYVLGGEVERFGEGGLVYIKSYQSWFRPVRVMLYEEGARLWEKLSSLRRSHDREIKAIREANKAEAEKLFGEKL